MADDKCGMFTYRIIQIFSLIIIFLSIIQLCREDQYGYKSLNDIDEFITQEIFKDKIKERIEFAKAKTITNLILNLIIYIYFSLMINPEKYFNCCFYSFFIIIFISISLIGLTLNGLAIDKYKSFNFRDDYIKINNETYEFFNGINNEEKINDSSFENPIEFSDIKYTHKISNYFENKKKYGKRNLKIDCAGHFFCRFQNFFLGNQPLSFWMR